MKSLRPYQIDLIDRCRKAFNDGYKAPCIVSPCGSGKSIICAEIAKCSTNKGNRVLFIVHRQELCEQIEATFTSWGVDMALCSVGMVQTVSRRLNRLQKPDLIITDENHHSLANSYKKIYDHWQDVPRLGVTATPIRLDGRGLADVNDILIEGISVKELIAMQCLSPFKYYAPKLIDTNKIRIKCGDFNQADIMEQFQNGAIYGDVISHYKKLSDGKQAICYCSTIEQSSKVAKAFTDSGIKAVHLDGDTPKAERKSIIEQFRNGEIMILCNVDLISEGFDVPDCNTAILLRPTQSLSLYIQQSMRCMRYKEGKQAIIIDHVGNVNRFGLPDTEHVWKLDAEKRKKARMDELPIKQCLECFAVYNSHASGCPYCGYRPQVEQREVAIIDSELVEIEEAFFTMSYKTAEECKNMKDLYALAKAKGYKRGWAYHQGKRRGFI